MMSSVGASAVFPPPQVPRTGRVLASTVRLVSGFGVGASQPEMSGAVGVGVLRGAPRPGHVGWL